MTANALSSAPSNPMLNNTKERLRHINSNTVRSVEKAATKSTTSNIVGDLKRISSLSSLLPAFKGSSTATTTTTTTTTAATSAANTLLQHNVTSPASLLDSTAHSSGIDSNRTSINTSLAVSKQQQPITSTGSNNNSWSGSSSSSNSNSMSSNGHGNKPAAVHVYGELIVLGYNGSIAAAGAQPLQPQPPSSRRASKFVLKRRDAPNAVKPSSQHMFHTPQEVNVTSLTHTLSLSLE